MAGDRTLLMKQAANVVSVGTINLLQHRARLLTALSGIAVALFLLMLQYESLTAVRERVTVLYSYFNFDIALVPDSYQILVSPGSFSRVRLSQARTLPQVARAFGVSVAVGTWAPYHGEHGNAVLMIGLDNGPDFIRDPEIRDGLPLLSDGRSVLFDRLSQKDVTPSRIGDIASAGDSEVEIKAKFDLGLFFYAAGGIVVPADTFTRLSGRDPNRITIGFLQVTPVADVAAVQAALKGTLPRDVQVLTHDELVSQEQAYFVETKPIGVMMDIGMLIAVLVAVTIIVQVLATEIGNRMNEYAVLKAMGFGPVFIYGIGVTQSAILGVAGLVPALVLSAVVFGIIQSRTHLRSGLDLHLAGLALAVALGTALVASATVLWRIERADPAELY
ncbi:MAG: FtsX-like permease family protein [Stellaceae bacterium]